MNFLVLFTFPSSYISIKSHFFLFLKSSFGYVEPIYIETVTLPMNIQCVRINFKVGPNKIHSTF